MIFSCLFRNAGLSILGAALLAGLACTKGNAKSGVVVLDTNKGEIVIELNEQKAPISSKTFLQYVDQGFYSGTVFHRVIPGFMIQGGGFTQELIKKPVGATIKNESDNGLSNLRGTLAMARTSNPNSATSQFFINLVDNKRLDYGAMKPDSWGYTVFAKVIDGMDVVDAIAKVTTRCPSRPPTRCTEKLPPGMRDVPAEAVVIQRASRK